MISNLIQLFQYSPQSESSFWGADFFSSISGAFFGALVAGVISWLLQNSQYKYQSNKEEVSRNQIHRAMLASCMAKMHKIIKNLSVGTDYIEKESEGKIAITDNRICLHVRSPIGTPGKIHFSSEEMALLLSLNAKVYSYVANLEDFYNSHIDMLDMYSRERGELLKLLDVKGPVLSTVVNVPPSEFEKPAVAAKLLSTTELLRDTFSDVKGAFVTAVDTFKQINKLNKAVSGHELPIEMPVYVELAENIRAKQKNLADNIK